MAKSKAKKTTTAAKAKTTRTKAAAKPKKARKSRAKANRSAEPKAPVKIKNLPGEKWKPLEFKAPTVKMTYDVSNQGRVRSTNKETGSQTILKGCILKGCNLRTVRIGLKDNRSSSVYVHQIVGQHFVRKKKADANRNFLIHLDGDKLNNASKNLKWATRKELWDFQVGLGLFDKFISRESNSKLTVAKVKQLKRMLKKGKHRKKDLAEKFGITTMQVRRIETGENWSYVTI